MYNDLTFITNEKGYNLYDRFKTLIKDTKYFDVLVGYFYLSGFYLLYPSLEKTEKIRILIGINAGRRITSIVKDNNEYELFNISHLDKNKMAIDKSLKEDNDDFVSRRRGKDNATKVLNILRTKQISGYKGFTDTEEELISKVKKALEDGRIPKHTTKNLIEQLEGTNLIKDILKVPHILKKCIPANFLKEHSANVSFVNTSSREVVLSECFVKG